MQVTFRARSLPWIVCVVLVALCGWFAFQLIDQSVTLDHQSQQTKFVMLQRDVLALVLNSIGQGTNEARIREILKDPSVQSSFEKGKDHLVADQVSFNFERGQLIRVDTAGTDHD
ncbi:MAG: hypothetical protein L0Y38_00010 [Methylococcaceae bacterium]|nr:hypothetical protein [Methylococcaceae bacterium]MCI0732191.1 hypothetical protein [Methylococcaceae bacterium]